MRAAPDIRIGNLTYRYPGTNRPALQDVTLEVGTGEIVLVTGASGAGKTTLCCTLNGMVPHSYGGDFEGTVTVKGRDTRAATIGDLAFIAGLLFQDPSSQLISPTVEDEVAFGPENKGLPAERVEKLVDTYLEYVGADAFRRRSPHALSGGQQQAVAIAAVLAMEPEIYVMDEPTSNLDPLGSQLVFDLLGKIVRDESKTALIVEHKLDKLVTVVDRVVVLADGRVALDGKPRDVLREYRSLERMGIRPPHVSVLVERLKGQGVIPAGEVPLTVAEAARILRHHLDLNPQRLSASPGFRRLLADGTRSGGEPVVEVESVSFSYPDGTQALRDVNLVIRRGEFVSLIGQNGSGKTTLAKQFNGLLKPSRGAVRLFGLDTRRTEVYKLTSRVGYCFQNPDHQLFCSRVWDEIEYGPKNLKVPEEERRRRIEDIAGRLGLPGLLEENPHNLGKGQRQKIAVASILAMGSEVLVVDEPTTGQDPGKSREMMELMKQLNEQAGKTVVVITHDMNLAAEYSDRVVVMAEGTVLLDGPPRDVFSRVDILRSTRLEPPQVTRLMQALGLAEPAVLTVDEAAAILQHTGGGSR